MTLQEITLEDNQEKEYKESAEGKKTQEKITQQTTQIQKLK